MKLLDRIFQKPNIRPKAEKTDSAPVSVPRKADREDAKSRRLKKVVIGQAALAAVTLVVALVVIFTATAAWYTNVSKIGTLTLKTQTWGFNLELISVGGDTVVSAAPGRSGIVPITVDNSGTTDRLTVNVSVSKSAMNAELQKRIYFYADAAVESYGEAVSPVWLGGSVADSYSYDVFPGRTLSLTEGALNDVPVKWTWVYDMLGFYFRGAVTGAGVTVSEYLRPIEYDLDRATFADDENNPAENDGLGALVSVGGIGIADDGGLLYAVSSSDGYYGTIDPRSSASGGDAVVSGGKTYYKVSVDESGAGVWAYINTGAEVAAAIDYDSTRTGAETGAASVNVTVDSVFTEPVVVNSESGLTSALSPAGSKYVSLGSDVTLTSAVALYSGDTVIDLCGHTLTFSPADANYSAFAVAAGASLTVRGGSVTGPVSGGAATGAPTKLAFTAAGADLTLQGVTVSGFDCAVYVFDSNSSGADSTVVITDCSFTTLNQCVYVMGNGETTSAESKLIVDRSTLTSSYVAVSGSAVVADPSTSTVDRWGTGIYITRSTLSGELAALYHPQRSSTAVIADSTLTGRTAVVVKGGAVTLRDCDVTGSGAYAAAAEAASGWTSTGGAIYVEATNDWGASVTVDGDGTVSSTYGFAVELFGKAAAGPGSISVNGGAFSGDKGPFNTNGDGVFVVNGGTFSGTAPAGVTVRVS